MLLPDTIFHSNGQAEIFLFLQLNRSEDDVLFFDCSEVEEFNREQVKNLQTLWMERKTIPGLCSCVSKATIQENDYNLNIPRYVDTFEEVDKAYSEVISKGAVSVLAPETEPWGQRTCYIADPEGNLIEITE